MQKHDDDWGPEIPIVDGVRPAWLGGDETIQGRYDWVTLTCEAWRFNWQQVIAIRLPRTHWAYLPLSRGFTPWAGGDEAPGDWDGQNVMIGAGHESAGRIFDWSKVGNAGDIIGYRRRGKVPADLQGREGPDTVTIKRMTEEEARMIFAELPPRFNDDVFGWMRINGLIRPTPTPAERIATETGIAVADVERVIAAMKEVG